MPIGTEFTPTQRTLLDQLWITQTEAKVQRRFPNPDGSYHFETVTRPTRPIDFAQDREFALKLHEKRPDAPLSPYYINLRELPGDLLILVAKAIAEATQGVKVDICTGIPAAGDPIAKTYSEITKIPLRKMFGKAEEESGRRIVKAPNMASTVQNNYNHLLILDDLVTEADTKLEAIEVAETLNYEVAGIAVLVDREQGGREQLEARGYKLFAPLPISRVFAYYYQQGMIDRAAYEMCMGYLNNARTGLSLPRLELI